MRSRKLNISLVSISKTYFAVSKDIRLNPKHHFIMKILKKKRTFKFKDFNKLYKDYTKEEFLFLMNDTTYHQIIHEDLGGTYYKMLVNEKQNRAN